MKRIFLRILPLAVAVLLATSCSKDENNDNAVVNNGQENVQTKTLPISITVNQKGLSKLTCANGTGVELQPLFEPGDELAIYKGETFVKNLEVTADKISADGKTATFEGEIEAEGLVDGQTQLTATIGTQITEAQTATSREDAVKKGCYQTAEFTYSSEGNKIQLEEQNAYIEVVWKNKGGEAVDFTFGSETVTLYLNDAGQGWIVVPAGQSFTCAALGITTEKTTEKANIYGISRKYVPEGYVDLGIVDENGKDVYWAERNIGNDIVWEKVPDKSTWPTKEDFVALWNNCYWQWGNDGTNNGYYVFKPYAATDKQKNNSSGHEYSTTSGDPYIFLPAAFYSGYNGIYWSSTPRTGGAYCLYFSSGTVTPENSSPVVNDFSVRLVRRSN